MNVLRHELTHVLVKSFKYFISCLPCSALILLEQKERSATTSCWKYSYYFHLSGCVFLSNLRFFVDKNCSCDSSNIRIAVTVSKLVLCVFSERWLLVPTVKTFWNYSARWCCKYHLSLAYKALLIFFLFLNIRWYFQDLPMLVYSFWIYRNIVYVFFVCGAKQIWETFWSKTKTWQHVSDYKCYTDKNKLGSNVIYCNA